MPDKILVTLACGTDNPNRATRALFIAATAKKKGKDVCMFLLDEGVYLAKKGITANMRAATGDDADDHLTYMQEFEVPILVCTPCAVAREIRYQPLDGVNRRPPRVPDPSTGKPYPRGGCHAVWKTSSAVTGAFKISARASPAAAATVG